MTLASIRATGHIAWRQARRAPWRSALVAAMVAIPIAALSGTAIVIQTVIPTSRQLVAEDMGTSDIVICESSNDLRPEALLHELPAGTRVVEGLSLASQNILRGSVVYLIVEEFPTRIDQPPLQGRLVILKGRAPIGTGEVALQPDVLAAFGVHIGEDIHLEDVGLTLHVTGTVVAPGHIRDPIAVVGPGTLAGQRDAGIEGFWIDLPAGASLGEAAAALSNDPRVQGYVTRSEVGHMNDRAAAAAQGAAYAAAAVALFGTGLIAAAAFVVGAKRQLRMLGLVGAQGGEPRHVRATVLFGGVSLGVLGSSVGVALGVIGALAVHPHLARFASRLIGPVKWPVLPLVGAAALGTAAATLAALGPARSAARLSTLDALAGRTSAPRKPGKLAGAGLVGVAIGVILTAWATVRHGPWILAVGLILTVGGFLVAIPLLVTWVGRLARYLPTMPRLAARDLARNGRRTGAALAAASIALALPVAVSALTLSNEAGQQRVPFMAPDQLSISLAAPGGHLEHLAGELVADLKAAYPTSIVVPLVPAGLAGDRPSAEVTGSRGSTVYAQGGTEVLRQGVSYVHSGALWIGGPDLLRAFHAERGTPDLEAGKVVAVGPDSTDHSVVHLVVEGESGEQPLMDLPAVEAGETRYASLSNSGEFNYVISPEAASRVGLAPALPPDQNAQFIFRGTGPLSQRDISRAKAITARHPGAFVVSLGDLGSHGGPVRTILTLSGAVVALAILAVVLALVGAEARRDRAILVAVGADARIRRRLSGANGFLIAALAGALAIPAGFTPVAIYEIAQRVGNPVVVPWATIALILFGVPLLAAALAALTSRQPDAARLLRPLA